jgi:glutaredoxin-dependent peroxiredoxin
VQKYDVANPDMLGLKNISKRAVFVIDKGGVVRHREVTASPGDEPNYQKIHDVLGMLR